MDVLIAILLIIFAVTVLAFIGFAITWVVGLSLKNNTTKKVGKVGMLIATGLAIVSFAGSRTSQHIYDRQLAENRKIFREYAEKFQTNYIITAYDIETGYDEIGEVWQDALGDDDMEDQVLEKVDDLSKNKIKKAMKDLKFDITMMKVNDTDDLDLSYKDFQKAYNDLEKFYRITYLEENSTYSSYNSKGEKCDNAVSSWYNKIKNFNGK